MIVFSSLIGNWEKMCVGCLANLSVFTFLFMICAIEVVLLKLTTSPIFDRSDEDYEDASEYEEDIYYENLRNNYEQWARRRMRYRQQQQRQEEELLQQHHRHGYNYGFAY